jgi:hypothetical protein
MAGRSVRLALAVAALAVLVALPFVVTAQSPPPGPPGQTKEKVEKTPVTLTGTVSAVTDSSGQTTYTLVGDGKTYTLDAGPPWFFGDDHPLKPYVGKSVSISGQSAAGSTEVDVLSVGGAVIREPGRPPWAGGWMRVGELHPGWSQEKAERFRTRFGDCFPPGQCRQQPTGPNPAASPTP